MLDIDDWLKSRLKGSVFFDWDQFSQPGAGSRGSLGTNPQVVADDLANSGFHINDTVYIYGKGSRGRGNEGRIAWLLYTLGFNKIHVTDFRTAKAWSNQPLESGPYIPTPVAKWTPKIRGDLTFKFSDFKEWASDKNKKYILIGLRGNSVPPLPGVYASTDLNISWRFFVEKPNEIRNRLNRYINDNKIDPLVTIFPVSFAGLSSAYVCLILKSWGYNSRLIPEGYSIELK